MSPTVIVPLAYRGDDERNGGEGEHQDDADQRLQQREHPSAHHVVDIGTEQRHAREIRDAGAEADASTKIIASATCGITAVSTRQKAANTSARPNNRRRDRSRANRGNDRSCRKSGN